VNFPRSAASNKFLGIGDPDFRGTSESSTRVSLAPLFLARGVANVKAIANLPQLPESTDELRAVARALDAPSDDLLLGPEASERELRKRPLNDYRVISFATHAIVAGEIEGVTEPALVLSPGQDEHNPQNDGLLTASEIANLTLDANLVILSACDTAASDGHISGRGLSGLANAFFFAGARSIAVTQWAVSSTVAQRLGAGLVSQAIASSTGGVAEGLREAMLDYIATAKEDYLANPRFWGAFIIAGDGAIRPLDGISDNDASHDAIHLDWEQVTQDSSDDEFVGLTKSSSGNAVYALGLEKPPAGEKRAGSYIARLSARQGDIKVISRDRELAALSIMGTGSALAVLGYMPAGNKSTAIFELLDEDGNKRWVNKQDGPVYNFPGSAIHLSEGFILVSVETDLSASPGQSTLILTLVSERGVTISQRRYPISIGSVSYAPKTVVFDSMGNLGTKRYCTTLPEVDKATTRGWRSAPSNCTSSVASSAVCVRNRLMHNPTGGRFSCSAEAKPASSASISSGIRRDQMCQWVGLMIASA
jgi:hypothetical protein